MPKTGRAKPLSPEERRAAIIEAVIPLLVEHGATVTTAEMATAAGIAEGTIFRVFPDKTALLHAAVATTLDPEPFQTAVAAIDTSEPFTQQLTIAAEILASRYEKSVSLIAMVRSIPHDQDHRPEAHRIAKESMAAVAASLTTLMARHQHQLTIPAEQAAILLRGLLFANAHQLLHGDHHTTTKQLVDVLLHGIAGPETN